MINPLCTYSLGSSSLLDKCKGLIKFTEIGKNGVTIQSAQDPNIILATQMNYCIGYINGFFDNDSLTKEKKYCLPDEIETYQIAKVYSKYLEDHPEKLHQNTNITFSEALITYFPCKN